MEQKIEIVLESGFGTFICVVVVCLTARGMLRYYVDSLNAEIRGSLKRIKKLLDERSQEE